jgi:hypothetical protein
MYNLYTISELIGQGKPPLLYIHNLGVYIVQCTTYIWSGRLQSTCRDQVIFIGYGGVEGGGRVLPTPSILDLSKLLTLLRGAFI